MVWSKARLVTYVQEYLMNSTRPSQQMNIDVWHTGYYILTLLHVIYSTVMIAYIIITIITIVILLLHISQKL